VLATRKSLAAIVAACALALGACGGDDSNDTGQTAPPPPGNGADRAFVNAILPLHDKAVAVAVIGRKRGNEFVKDISSQVAASQPQETARLRGIGSALFAAGVPVGTLGVAATNAADVDLKALQTAKPFEKAFLEAMIPIHEATIALAKAEIDKGDQVDLKTTSQAIIDAEQAQLKAMRKRLKEAQ
jgi:uncharacterized protein (DUF305 family)